MGRQAGRRRCGTCTCGVGRSSVDLPTVLQTPRLPHTCTGLALPHRSSRHASSPTTACSAALAPPPHRVCGGQLLQAVRAVQLPAQVQVVARGLGGGQGAGAGGPVDGWGGRVGGCRGMHVTVRRAGARRRPARDCRAPNAGGAAASALPSPRLPRLPRAPRPGAARLEGGRGAGQGAKGHKGVHGLLAELAQRGVGAGPHVQHLYLGWRVGTCGRDGSRGRPPPPPWTAHLGAPPAATAALH